jgi:hypothetical protein
MKESERIAIWKKNNPDKVAMQRKRHRSRNPEKIKENRIKQTLKKYNITIDEYDRLFASQNGRCAICGKSTKTRLAVDHNHKTNNVRQLLCTKCNLIIGCSMEDISILENSINYIKRWNKEICE